MSNTPRLEVLVSRHQQLHSQGQPVTVEELCADCPELIAAVRIRLAAAASGSTVPPTLNLPTDSAVEVAPQTLVGAESNPVSLASLVIAARTHPAGLPTVPGYELLGELGRGGMGVVYKAKHLGLKRIVALKMVLSGAHAGPTDRARFLVEAEAVASLQHPNIIQVYEVGEHDYCPFLALEYVDGGGLDRLLGGKPQPPRAAAELVETLARAMHTAHLRGIVHRDLKPANILVAVSDASQKRSFSDASQKRSSGERFCEASLNERVPKITDFGLAKRVEAESQTHSGSVLGTPGYMAPEQALGQLRDVGPHSDVYSLGAILYETLAGVPPFRARTVMETLTLSTTEEAKPPSQAGAGPVPRDLETICLKCLQKDPKKRYPTAGELADDLRRYLEGEPIQARPVGRLERTVKWVRRRPTAAALMAVSVLAALALLSLGVWYNARLRIARDRAERRAQFAREAVNDMYTQVAEKWLGNEPHMDDLQRQFLLKAARVYEELANEDDQNPALRRETGLALFRVGQIYRLLNRRADAEGAFDRAIALQGDLLQKSPGAPEYRQDLANSYNWRGELFRTNNSRLRDALASYDRARELQQTLVDEYPRETAYRQELARSHDNRGIVLGQVGRRKDEARAEYQRAIGLLRAVVRQVPQQAGPRQELARVYLNLGKLLRELKQYDDARTAFQEAVTLLDELQAAHRGNPEYRFELAVALTGSGNLAAQGYGNLRRAEQECGRARELLAILVTNFTERPAYSKELANAWNSLGAIYVQQGGRWRTAGKLLRPLVGDGTSRVQQAQDEAAAAWQRAHKLYRALADRWPEAADYQDGAARAAFNGGWLALERDRAAEARGQLQDAIKYQRLAVRLSPESDSYRQELSKQYKTLARALRRLNDKAGAAAAAAEAERYKLSPGHNLRGRR